MSSPSDNEKALAAVHEQIRVALRTAREPTAEDILATNQRLLEQTDKTIAAWAAEDISGVKLGNFRYTAHYEFVPELGVSRITEIEIQHEANFGKPLKFVRLKFGVDEKLWGDAE